LLLCAIRDQNALRQAEESLLAVWQVTAFRMRSVVVLKSGQMIVN
jgi:hypothetical protein